MKVLILAGGFGTRLGEETGVRPKPMVEIGGKPILWHIMKHYSSFGFNEFVILCGYKGEYIKKYFADYFLQESSVTFDLKENTMEVVKSNVEPWKVTLLDTGANSLTGGRIKRAEDIVGDEPFMLTYGDGVSDIDVEALLASHQRAGKLVTMSVIRPTNRFGTVELGEDGEIKNFKEKAAGEMGWINGGFFVCEPGIFNFITSGDETNFERMTLESLAEKSMINCFQHDGFWKCMDTLADKNNLNSMWESGDAKWKTWDN